MPRLGPWAVLAVLLLVAPAAADEVILINGDRLTGTVTESAPGKLTIKTDLVGDVTVDLAKVRTFSTAKPVQLKVGDKQVLNTPVAPGPEGTVQVTPQGTTAPQPLALKDVSQVNPPPVRWTGSVVGNAMFTSGNSTTETIGLTAGAERRSEIDRITFGGQYLYGRQEDADTGDKETTTDNWFIAAKYDYFFTKKFYGYAGIRVEQDKIADLDIRVTPSVGVGYQWFESPTFNLSTEAGLAWVYESFSNAGTDEHFAARLAYHVDWRPWEPLLLFHNLEYLPSLSDPAGDYNLNADAGLRATIVKSLFSEIKLELRHDSTPAPGAEESDFRLLVGVGWTF
jgi:putative salt-induced outer membrane protein YdiY